MTDPVDDGVLSVDTLRAHLFATLKALRDPKDPMEIERAKAISDVAQVIINSAKVEVEYLKANGGGDSEFITAVGRKNLPPGITGVRRHKLTG